MHEFVEVRIVMILKPELPDFNRRHPNVTPPLSDKKELFCCTVYTFSEEKRLIFILQIQSISENYRFKWIEVIDKCFERFATVVAVPVLKFRCCGLNASEKFSVTLVYNRILNSVSISDGRRFGCRSYVGGSLQEGG